MKIAVLGGGNGSYAAAADLALLGHDVSFWRRDRARLEALRATGRITLINADGRHEVPLSRVTVDIGEAVRDARLIVIPTPAFAQEDIATAIAPHLGDGQVIFLPPGTFGSYVMMRAIRRAGCSADISIAETGTLPWLARKHGPAEVAITIRATRLPTGVFPACNGAKAFPVLQEAFPSVEPIEDALAGALMNAGPIIHPPLILMNAGPLEHFDAWDIHNEGTQPSIRRVTDMLDNERIAVRKGLGYNGEHFPLRDHYTSDRWMYGDAHKRLVDSGDWHEKIVLTEHRYMTEDVHYGLAFLVSVGDWAGVDTPIATGLLAIASAICAKNLREGERTLEGLGLAGLQRDQFRTLLTHGATP